MKRKSLHPSVIKFKEFVKSNPKLIHEVRQGRATWQELYEDWYLLGEEDERWETIGNNNQNDNSKTAPGKNGDGESSDERKSDWMSSITGAIKNMDANQLQYHINNLSQAIGAIQGVLAQFQGSKGMPSQPGQRQEPDSPRHPFTFRKD